VNPTNAAQAFVFLCALCPSAVAAIGAHAPPFMTASVVVHSSKCAACAVFRTAEEQRTQSCTRRSLAVIVTHEPNQRGPGICIPLRSLPLCGSCNWLVRASVHGRVRCNALWQVCRWRGLFRTAEEQRAPSCTRRSLVVSATREPDQRGPGIRIPLRSLPLCGSCFQRVCASFCGLSCGLRQTRARLI